MITFCIITHVPHSQSNGNYFGYAPYVNEMNIWLKYVDKVIVVAPLKKFDKGALHQEYQHPAIEFIAVPDFSLTTVKALFKTIVHLPLLLISISKAMDKSTHLHLRCPGNMGLLGSVLQILFPKKAKTAKYAGNWDSHSKQPFTYRLQRKIISNTFLTRNMTVLVYGNWNNQTKNIKPFFTATYFEKEKSAVLPKVMHDRILFLFVGSLTAGKQPILALKLVEALKNRNYNVALSVYGDGIEKHRCDAYIQQHDLSSFITLHDSIGREELKAVYQQSHFLLLPSRSEGWPKVVAEAMFWGCLPIATPVSCVSDMLDYGNRGILFTSSFAETVTKVEEVLGSSELYAAKIKEAVSWSRNYTIDKFEDEIKKLLST